MCSVKTLYVIVREILSLCDNNYKFYKVYRNVGLFILGRLSVKHKESSLYIKK